MKINYTSFDDLFVQASADADPVGFVDSIEKPIILDEIQCAPKIFLPLKNDIDKHLLKGRYLFTGSVNPLVIQKIGDSLAGRMQILNLWPLSQGELRDVFETFIDRIFSPLLIPVSTEPMSKEELLKSIVKGGYPALQLIDTEKERYEWCNSYLTTLIQKDIADIARIENCEIYP